MTSGLTQKAQIYYVDDTHMHIHTKRGGGGLGVLQFTWIFVAAWENVFHAINKPIGSESCVFLSERMVSLLNRQLKGRA